MKKLFLGLLILVFLTTTSYAEKRKYYKTGELKFLFPTKINGKLEGTVTEYYRNGDVKYKWNYYRGKKHGIAKKYENGSLRYTWYYKHGKRSITTKEYSRNGSFKQKWKYRNGKLSSNQQTNHKRYQKYKKEVPLIDYCVK